MTMTQALSFFAAVVVDRDLCAAASASASVQPSNTRKWISVVVLSADNQQPELKRTMEDSAAHD